MGPKLDPTVGSLDGVVCHTEHELQQAAGGLPRGGLRAPEGIEGGDIVLNVLYW